MVVNFANVSPTSGRLGQYALHAGLQRLNRLGRHFLRQACELLALLGERFKLLACVRGRQFKKRPAIYPNCRENQGRTCSSLDPLQFSAMPLRVGWKSLGFQATTLVLPRFWWALVWREFCTAAAPATGPGCSCCQRLPVLHWWFRLVAPVSLKDRYSHATVATIMLPVGNQFIDKSVLSQADNSK